MKATWWLAACLAILAHPGKAEAQNTLPDRSRRAERVVVATIIAVDAVFETNEYGDQLIVSKTTLRVDETLKGPRDLVLDVSVEGGTIDGLTLDVSDMPAVKPGERAAFFLVRARNGMLVPSDRGRGIMKLDASNRVEDSTLTLDDVRKAVRDAR